MSELIGSHFAQLESESPTCGQLILSPGMEENYPARNQLSLSSEIERKIPNLYIVVKSKCLMACDKVYYITI